MWIWLSMNICVIMYFCACYSLSLLNILFLTTEFQILIGQKIRKKLLKLLSVWKRGPCICMCSCLYMLIWLCNIIIRNQERKVIPTDLQLQRNIWFLGYHPLISMWLFWLRSVYVCLIIKQWKPDFLHRGYYDFGWKVLC